MKKLIKKSCNSVLKFALIAALAFSVSCTNNRYKSSASSSNLTTAGTGPVSSANQYTITTVNIQDPASSSNAMTSVFFDTSQNPNPISSYCSAVSCVCHYSWNEVNPNNGSPITIARAVNVTATVIQPNLVQCPTPSLYSTEIPNGTPVLVSVIPGNASSAFATSTYQFTKNATSVTGTFQDAQGQSFDNILHYSCYEKFQKGMNIQSLLQTQSVPSNTVSQVQYPLASQFCFTTSKGGAANANCPSSPAFDYSSQANYYNLYIRQSEVGDIQPQNQRYVCPQVKESLLSGLPGYWPLDTNFALALSPSPNFPVGVEAFIELSNSASLTAGSSACYPTAGASGTPTSQNDSSLVNSCLGFASQTHSDGTCPTFADSQGITHPTYRLRRYVALYPPVFDTDGSSLSQPQLTDTIYVLDRPVSSSTANPLSPYTMLGPKPCPFSYFDKAAVTSSTPSYAATGFEGWTGTNIDGIQFPNFDYGIGANNHSQDSCSAVLPVFNSTSGIMSLATVNAANPAFKKAYIRPVRAWSPHYEEDTSFQACAPQSTIQRDPPLHFAKVPSTINGTTMANAGNTQWCAEYYPSQNDNVAYLDPSNTGAVFPFTSHVSKNLTITQSCQATMPSLPGGYPASGHAAHLSSDAIDVNGSTTVFANATCDRTAVNSATGQGWTLFPILARPAQVESAIQADGSYGCTISYDNGSGKSGTLTPTGGCCLVVNMKTGTSASGSTSAHLEPLFNPAAGAPSICGVPQY